MFLTLEKGQEKLKTLLIKEKKKKAKKSIGVLNLGRRFKGYPKQAQNYDIPSDEDNNQGEDDKSVKAGRGSNLCYGQYSDTDEEDYSAE